jgi:translation initiation factor IF-3
MINDEIDFAPSKIIRAIGNDNEPLGLITLGTAKNMAFDKGFDLVLIAPTADPPVCRIMDYGKFRFERDKKDKEARKKTQVVEVKEIQLTCHIDTNDLNTKINNAQRILGEGDKIRLIVKFKGRQMGRLETGYELLAKFEQACAEYGSSEKKPILEGRNMIMFLAPIKQSTAKDQNKSQETASAPAAPVAPVSAATPAVEPEEQTPPES